MKKVQINTLRKKKKSIMFLSWPPLKVDGNSEMGFSCLDSIKTE